MQQDRTLNPPPPPPAINPSHHRGTKEVGSCNRNNKVMSHSRPSGMRLCLCLCPVLIRKGRETASPSLAAGGPMHVGPSRSFSLRDNHLRTPSLRQNSPQAAIWDSPVPSFWTPRAVQWLDGVLPGSWKLELDWSRSRSRARCNWEPVADTPRTVETRVSRWPGSSRRSPDQPNQLFPHNYFSRSSLGLVLFWLVPGWVVQTDRWQGRPA